MIELNSPEVISLLNEYSSCEDEKVKKILKKKIAASCIPYVKKIARSLARRNTDPIEDLIQVGCVGLLKAIDQYDAKQKSSFRTYATYYITGEIRHYLRDKVSMIRAPREVQELAFRINTIISDLTKELGRTPTDFEISERLSMPVQKINEIVEIDRRKVHISLDNASPLYESENFMLDKIVDDKYQDYIKNKEENIMLLEAIEMLPQNLQDVIRMSFFQDMNQSEIAQEVGVSQMQVSRRIKKALDMLANIMVQNRE